MGWLARVGVVTREPIIDLSEYSETINALQFN